MVKGDKVLGIIFPNMHEDNVKELTQLRTMASVPFGGRYRLIDFTLSEMVNAGVDDVALIPNRNYISLMDHLGSGKEYDLSRKNGGLKIFPPFAEVGSLEYNGKIEALNNIIEYIETSACDTVILADGNIVSSIDYNDVFEKHMENGAQITAIYKKETIEKDLEKDNITFQVDDDGRVNSVYINENSGVVANNGMWAYVIDKKLLVGIIREFTKKGITNFEKYALQENVCKIKIYGYEYKGFLRRISSVSSYFKSNIDLLDKKNLNALFSNHPIYTKIRDDAPVRYAIGSEVKNAVVADGCFIEGYVDHSVLFRDVKIGKGAIVTNCILMQDTVIEDGAVLENVICDKEVKISSNKRLIGDENHPIFVAKRETV